MKDSFLISDLNLLFKNQKDLDLQISKTYRKRL